MTGSEEVLFLMKPTSVDKLITNRLGRGDRPTLFLAMPGYN